MQRSVQSLLMVIVTTLIVTQLPWHRLTGNQQSTPSTMMQSSSVLVDVNQAPFRELALLPNVGPVLAKRIVADRNQHGCYDSLDDLARVHGIGQKTIQHLAKYCEASECPITLDRLAAADLQQ